MPQCTYRHLSILHSCRNQMAIDLSVQFKTNFILSQKCNIWLHSFSWPAFIVHGPLLPDIRVHWKLWNWLWPHYVALFRGHLNFSTVSLLSQTTFRYSMSNKSPEQLSPLFVQKLTNVTGPFYISPGSAELANWLCLCIISYSLSPYNQILFLWLNLLFPLLRSCGPLRREMN